MSKFNGKLVVPAMVVLCLLLVGAGYAMGRKNINPFRPAAVTPETDSAALAQTTYKRCGKLSGEARMKKATSVASAPARRSSAAL